MATNPQQDDPEYKEYQDYLDYQDYQKYLGSHQQAQPEQSMGQKALGLIGGAANKLDSYTGAPMRAAIGAAQDADSPMDIPLQAGKAALKQFGADPGTAPTGEQLVEKAGVPNKSVADIPSPFVPGQALHINPAKIAGSAMDMAANPLNLAGPVLKGASKAAEFLPEAADLASGAAEKLKSFANEKALKAAGAMTKDFRMIQDKGISDSLGQFLLDNKMVTPLATVSKVAERLEKAKETAGQTIGHILDTADMSGAPPISAAEIALKLSEDPEIMGLTKVPGKEKTASQISNYLQTLYKNGDLLSLRDAQKLRQGIDESINFNKRVPEMAGAQPYLYKMRDALSEKMNDAVNALPSGAGADSLKQANQAYSKLSTLDRIAQNRLGALSSNRTVSLTDTMAGLAGAAMGHHTPVEALATGAGLAAANKAARTFGPGLMATGANALSKGAESLSGAGLPSVPVAAGPMAAGLIPMAGLLAPESSPKKRAK